MCVPGDVLLFTPQIPVCSLHAWSALFRESPVEFAFLLIRVRLACYYQHLPAVKQVLMKLLLQRISLLREHEGACQDQTADQLVFFRGEMTFFSAIFFFMKPSLLRGASDVSREQPLPPVCVSSIKPGRSFIEPSTDLLFVCI